MRKVLLIITGSVAAYKSLDLIRLLKKADYEVTPIVTKGASEFITPLLVSSISGNDVYSELFSLDDEAKMGHINLSRANDLVLVVPASADIIGKMAGAMADDLASTVLMATNKPVFIAPAMNDKMWLNKNTQANIAQLRENGVKILEPEVDILACGEYGVGKMISPDKIFEKVEYFFSEKKALKGKKVIVTAGPTYEPIDPVRFIGNYSSGKQGICIAEKLADLGADVTLIAANVGENISLSKDKIIRVRTAKEMLLAIKDNIDKCKIFISAAAVCDFKPKDVAKEKIKKSSADSLENLELVENVDILKTVSNSKRRPKIVVGFAAESENLIKNAKVKLKEKNCDLMVANDIEKGKLFGSNYNKVCIINKKEEVRFVKKMTKVEIAGVLADELVAIVTCPKSRIK